MICKYFQQNALLYFEKIKLKLCFTDDEFFIIKKLYETLERLYLDVDDTENKKYNLFKFVYKSLTTVNKKELINYCKINNIKNYTKYNKNKLIHHIINYLYYSDIPLYEFYNIYLCSSNNPDKFNNEKHFFLLFKLNDINNVKFNIDVNNIYNI